MVVARAAASVLLAISAANVIWAQPVQTHVFTHLAGSTGGAGYADAAGREARFNSPRQPAVDPAGNIIVPDSGNHVIRRVARDGVVTTVAGKAGERGSQDGPVAEARFSNPHAVAVANDGIIYVADRSNSAIRAISPAGIVTTFAGKKGQIGSADGVGGEAQFYAPEGLAIDAAGNLFVADTFNHTVRKITPAGEVSTLAGAVGERGFLNGTGSAARFLQPRSIAADAAGVLYVADSVSGQIRRISPAGEVSALSFGGSDWPSNVAVDPTGTVLVGSAYRIFKITAAGDASLYVGKSPFSGSATSTDGTLETATFNGVAGMTFDSGGNLFVSDDSDAIRRITPEGTVSTLAGAPVAVGEVDANGAAARFNAPSAVTVDGSGNVFVADAVNHRIRKISPAGTVTTVARSFGDSVFAPRAVAVDSRGNLFYSGSSGGLYKKDPNGAVSLVGFIGGGFITGLAIDDLDNVYVASPDMIHKVSPESVVTFLAGGERGHVDGAGAAARFSTPSSLAVDGEGNVYVADVGNGAVRKISPAGLVTTAITREQYGTETGTSSAPRALAIDPADNVYVVDNGSRITRIKSDGSMITVAGAAGVGSTDGPAEVVQFNWPDGLAIDQAGNFYVADTNNHAIRKGTLTTTTVGRSPVSTSVNSGATMTLEAFGLGSGAQTYEWQRNGTALVNGTASTAVLTDFQPQHAGLYRVIIGSDGGFSTSAAAIVGVAAIAKTTGMAAEIGPNILHTNGNWYDQVLLEGAAATVTADAGQVTRTSFVDLDDDIVQVELSGPGAVSLVLDNPSGPAPPVNYNQPKVQYMKGHVAVVITGATENTHLTIFSVGRANAGNLTLFKDGVTYGGIADVAYVAILSADGKFGGLRSANVNYYATKGLTGVYAPGVEFTGPVYIGDITAFDDAEPVLVVGGARGDTWIAGGDLEQMNGRAVGVRGLTRLEYRGGTTSHSGILQARMNKGRLELDGLDVTAEIVVNP